jgi:molecular chaperone DnaK
VRLDLDGILHVTAIEKKTGLSKHVAISGATRRRNQTEITRSREELDRLFANRLSEDREELTESVPPVESMQMDAFGSLTGDAGPAVAEPASRTFLPDQQSAQGAGFAKALVDAQALLARCRQGIPAMHAEDQEEAVNLIEDIDDAITEQNADDLSAASEAIREFLFFVEGR